MDLRSRTRLLKRVENIPRVGWTYQVLKDLIDTLWHKSSQSSRCNSHYLTAGTHRIDFMHAFPAGSQYRIDWKAMSGDYLVGSKLSGEPDESGFSIYVAKDCTFDYTATLYY